MGRRLAGAARGGLASLFLLTLGTGLSLPAQAAVEVPAIPYSTTPKLQWGAVPIPMMACFMTMDMTNLMVAGLKHEANVQAGYFWSRNYFYDPAQARPAPPSGLSGDLFWNNTWQLRGRYWVWVQPALAFGLNSGLITGGVDNTGVYDARLTQGVSGMVGPFVEFNTLDHQFWPTSGARGRAWVTPGLHLAAMPASPNFVFWQMQAEWLQAWNWMGNLLLARVVTGAGLPQLAWIDKFSAGGGNFLRGYQWNRFTGDRLAAASLEYRRGLGAWRINPFGLLGTDGLPISLAGAAYVDGGRVWEPRLGPQVGEDLRLGGGVAIILAAGGVPLGRVELNGSGEGFFPVVAAGTSF